MGKSENPLELLRIEKIIEHLEGFVNFLDEEARNICRVTVEAKTVEDRAEAAMQIIMLNILSDANIRIGDRVLKDCTDGQMLTADSKQLAETIATAIDEELASLRAKNHTDAEFEFFERNFTSLKKDILELSQLTSFKITI